MKNRLSIVSSTVNPLPESCNNPHRVRAFSFNYSDVFYRNCIKWKTIISLELRYSWEKGHRNPELIKSSLKNWHCRYHKMQMSSKSERRHMFIGKKGHSLPYNLLPNLNPKNYVFKQGRRCDKNVSFAGVI